MPFSQRNPKEVAERLRGNLDYYNRPGRWRRRRFAASALALGLGAASVWAYYRFQAPEAFNNPGPISRAHAPFANRCASCHPQGDQIKQDSHRAGEIVRAAYFAPIDGACLGCHQQFDFHAPNTVPDRTRPMHVAGLATEQSSCTSCHREHVTAGKMVSTGSESCADCHARPDLMAASAQAGRAFPARAFPTNVKPRGAENLRFFPKTRPPNGYTEVFAAFDQGHPAFQTETARETGVFDTLRYNHHLHDQGKVLFDERGNRRVPDTERGDRLSCAYCHQPDPSGVGFGRITFAQNCAGCHDVRFDPFNPDLVVPHRDPEAVRQFLRGLDTRYLDLARARGLNGPAATQFAVDNLNRLRERVQSGENFERQIFFNKEWVAGGTSGGGANNPTSASGGPNISRYLPPSPNAARPNDAAVLAAGTRGALFPGCALCHQITPAPNGLAPVVVKVQIPDRWFWQGRFPHSKHIGDGSNPKLTCAGCHGTIARSELTSEVNLPPQASCTQCHHSGPKGVANDCGNCHHYHNDPRAATAPRPATAAASGRESPLRAMLAGTTATRPK